MKSAGLPLCEICSCPKVNFISKEIKKTRNRKVNEGKNKASAPPVLNVPCDFTLDTDGAGISKREESD